MLQFSVQRNNIWYQFTILKKPAVHLQRALWVWCDVTGSQIFTETINISHVCRIILYLEKSGFYIILQTRDIFIVSVNICEPVTSHQTHKARCKYTAVFFFKL